MAGSPSRHKIDLHTHILPDKWPDLKERYGYGGWITMEPECRGHAVMKYDDGRFFRRVEPNCWSPEDRIADMDRTGVTIQALSTVPVLFSYWVKPNSSLDLTRAQNKRIMEAGVQSHPISYVDVQPAAAAVPSLELTTPGSKLAPNTICGILSRIGCLSYRHSGGLLQTAEELGVGVFVHPWDMPQTKRMSKYWLPWLVGMPAETTAAICDVIFGGVLEKFPRLKLCFAHGAGAFPYTVGRIQRGFDARPDLCAVDNDVPPTSYLGKFYSDSLVMSPKALKLLVDTLGEDKVMLGSDYPFPLGEADLPGRLIEESSFGETIKEKLLWRNAATFLGIDIDKA
ncbi:unnamed protein product [Ixodes persulcatus]